jgi:trans-aconitate 2-methyltransferase
MESQPKSREWDSSAYQRISGPQFSWGKKVLARVSLRGDETVLDAGCGTGRLTRELLELLPCGRVVGVDLSENMLRTAREQLQDFHGRVEVVFADLQHLPFRESFDGIFSTAAFHWVPDHDQLFHSLHDALRPGGWLIAQCGGDGNLKRLLERVAAFAATPRYAPYLAKYRSPWVYSDPQEAAHRMRNAGFTDIETGQEEAPTVFPDARQYSEFVSNVILHRHLEMIPDAAVRYQFLDDLAELAAQDDPPFLLDYRRLNLSGRRAP